MSRPAHWMAMMGLCVACSAPPDLTRHRTTTIHATTARPATSLRTLPANQTATEAQPAPTPVAESPAPGAAAKFPLSRAYPTLARKLPRAPLGRWPTPVTELSDLAATLGIESLHVKRDDLSAEPYGGGKARKLELLLGQAVAEHRRHVITFGGVGSHHAVATAIYGRQLGLQTHLFLLPQPPTDEVCRVVLTCLAQGATLQLVGSLPVAQRRAARLVAAAPDDTLIIAAGGSLPLGNVGFVNAAFELAEQIEQGLLPAPDELVIALGTMGSAVGLSIGLAAAELDTTIVAVRASSQQAASWRKLVAMHRDTVTFLRDLDPSFPEVELSKTRLRIESRFLGRGYALPTHQGKAASRLAAKLGLRLDDTYTAKAFAALLTNAGRPEGSGHLLFWHTHSARPLEPRGADPQALPPSLRGYASCRTGP